MTNKNSQYINSLVDYINDTKPFRCKLTEVVEEYQLFDTMNVSLEEKTFVKTKINSVSQPFNFFSSGDVEYNKVQIKQLVSTGHTVFSSNASASHPGALKAFRDEITDFAGMSFVYSKKSFDGPGISEVFVQRNGDTLLREPLLEGHDYFQSHGAAQISIKQILDANLKFEPMWIETREDNVMFESFSLTRRLLNDYSNPLSAIRQIEALLVQMRTGLLNAIDSSPYDFNQFPFSSAPKEPGTNVPISGNGIDYTTTGLKLVDNLLLQIRVPQDYQTLYNSAIADGVVITPSTLTGYDLIVYLQERIANLSVGTISLLNNLLVILDSALLPRDYEELLHILINGDPGDIGDLPINFPTAPVPIIPGYEAWLGSNPLLHPLDSTPSSYDFWPWDEDPYGYDNGSPLVFDKFVDDQLSHLTPSIYFNLFTDFAQRHSGIPRFGDVKSDFINITNVIADVLTSPGNSWRVIATSNSTSSYDVISGISGYIGSFTISGVSTTFTSGQISFVATKVMQPEIGQEVSIENSNRFVINQGAPLETWNLIKVNPLSYTRPIFSSLQYGYIKDLNDVQHRVSLLNLLFVPQPLLKAEFVLTAQTGGQYFDVVSTEIGYTALAQVDVPFNDGNIAFTIVSGLLGPFIKGDRFFFSIQNEAQPIKILDLSLDFGYDLDAYDAQELVYNNTSPLDPDYNRPLNFAYGSRFVDYDVSSMNVVATAAAVNNRQWRLNAIPNLSKPIATLKKDASISNAVDLQDPLIGGDPLMVPLYSITGAATPDLKLYYADSFSVEWSDDGFNTVTSMGTVPVGGSFSDIGQGLSFDILPGNKPFVAVESDDHISGVETGGDVFSFRIFNVPSRINEHPTGVISSTFPRLVVHGDGFHETVSANWGITFTSATTYEIVGYLLEGNAGSLVPGTPLSCSLNTAGTIQNEGYSIDALGLSLTIYPGIYGFTAGDVFTFTTFIKKPSILVHGSTSGWQKPAIVGETYWNGIVGFKIKKPEAKLINPITKNHIPPKANFESYIATPIVASHTTLFNLPYGADPCQFVNVYMPAGFIKGVILRIHGGGWSSGNVLPWPSPITEEPTLAPLADLGYTVVDVNYRGINNSAGANANGIFPNNIDDIVTVLQFCTTSNIGSLVSGDSRWQDLYSLILQKGFVVTGTSAGGHLAIMGVCTYGTAANIWPIAVECVAGPLNLNYNNIFIDPLVEQIVVDPYITAPDLNAASPFFMYGTSASPGPWFNAVNNSPCDFIFIHNANDSLVTDAMARDAILNFEQYSNNATAIFLIEGPPKGDFLGTTPVDFKGNTPDTTTASLPTFGNVLGDAWLADGQYWVYNNGSYAGDAKNPASINGFTRWFDHNYVGSEEGFIESFAGQYFAGPPVTLIPSTIVYNNYWEFGSGSFAVTRIRFDSPTIDYWLTPTPIGSTTPTGWIVYRSDIGVAGHLPLNGTFVDQYISIETVDVPSNVVVSLQLSIVADSMDWWNAQDAVIIRPSIDAKLPTANDFVLIDKTTKDHLGFNLSYGSVASSNVPSLTPLAPVFIDQRFIDIDTGYSPISLETTSPDTAILNNWIPFTVKEYDSLTSTAGFSDNATRIKLISAGSGETIGTVVQENLEYPWSSEIEWDVNFFAKYLPLNSEANIVVYGSGFNEKINVRLSENLRFLVDSGSLTTDFQFKESVHLNVSEYHSWNIIQYGDDPLNVAVQDSPFGGFLPGYDNLPYDFETQTGDINLSGGGYYDAGVPFTDYFYEARQLSGIDPLTAHQLSQTQLERDTRLAVVLSQLNGFLNGTIQNTSLEYFLTQLDLNVSPIGIATGFGIPLRGLGIEINIKAGETPGVNAVGAAVIDALILFANDPSSAFDANGFDSDGLDAEALKTAIINVDFASSIPAVIPPFTTFADFETPLSIEGYQVSTFEFNFTITTSNLSVIQNMQTPLIYMWVPSASSPIQVPIVYKLDIGKYQVKYPTETEAKFYIINPP